VSYEDYRCLDVAIREGVAFVSIDHPPINLFDTKLMAEMDRLGREFEDDAAVRVIVFQSRDPDFFIAHADVNLIQRLPSTAEEKSDELNFFHAMVERFRSMPKTTIGKIEGCARGGGSEFLLSLDMRFGALGRCVLSQPEVAIGILPGGSGTQHLPRLMGRGRALEAILGCEDFDAETAERYGWINRALPPHELGPFVERLARRIASFSPEAIALAKRSVEASALPIREGLLEEAWCFQQTLAIPSTREKLAAFMQGGGQTREVELSLGSSTALADPGPHEPVR
jgi:enoyl-CoA hydratase/carnithine racemase